MDMNTNISALVQYGLDKKLIEPCDKAFIINQLLTPQQLDSYDLWKSVLCPWSKS